MHGQKCDVTHTECGVEPHIETRVDDVSEGGQIDVRRHEDVIAVAAGSRD